MPRRPMRNSVMRNGVLETARAIDSLLALIGLAGVRTEMRQKKFLCGIRALRGFLL
jgi:hypothetical protein